MQVICVLLVAVLVCSLCNAEPVDNVMVRARNEFFDQINAGRIYESITVGLEGRNMTFSLNGTIRQAIITNFTANDSPEYNFAVVGFAVYQCIVQSSYAFKFQLRDDSCGEAFIQYFADANCSKLTSTLPLLKVISSTNKIQCTTKHTPLYDPRYLVSTLFYADAERDGPVVQYVSYPLFTCITVESQSLVYSCTKGAVLLTFNNSNCTGSPAEVEHLPATYELPLLGVNALSDNNIVKRSDNPVASLYAAVRCIAPRTTRT